MRFSALSRAIESALQKEGISSRVLGGHKFFERAEVCSIYYVRGWIRVGLIQPTSTADQRSSSIPTNSRQPTIRSGFFKGD